MSMRDILDNFRTFLLEAELLPKEAYSVIEDALAASEWWEEDNDQEDVRRKKTPLTIALETATQEAMKELGLNTLIKIESEPTVYMEEDDPYSVFVGGEYVGEKDLLKFSIAVGATSDIEGFNPAEANFNFATMIRHELIHGRQTAKQAKSKGLTHKKAFLQLLDDPRQVVDSGAKKYWDVWEPTGEFDKKGNEIIKKDGFRRRVYMTDYLTRHIEMDAYAHQAAEKLLRAYGEKEALDVLSRDFDLQDPVLPDDVKKYKNYVSDKKKLDKFRSKVYSYIMVMEEE